jgi:PAS domain S-box-containing protein
MESHEDDRAAEDSTIGGTDGAEIRRRAEARFDELLKRGRNPRDPAEFDRILHELGVHQAELELQNEELRRTQAALSASSDRYRDLFEDAPVGYLTLGLDGRIVEANRLAAAMCNTGASQLVSQRFSDLLQPADRPRYQLHLKRLLCGEGAQYLEVRLRPHASDARWIGLQISLTPGPEEGSPHCRATIVDIDARVHMQEGVGRLAAIVASSEDAIISRDLQDRVTSWNDGARRMFGYEAEQMIGRTLQALVPPERRREEAGLLRRISRGESIAHLETERLAREGVLVPVSMSVSPIRDDRKRVAGSALIMRDMSERRRTDRALHERLRQLDVLSEAGQALILSGQREASTMRRDLLERMRVAVDCDICLDFALDEPGGNLRLQSSHGLDPATAASWSDLPIERCGFAEVARRHVARVVDELQSKPEDGPAPTLKSTGARCAAVFPLSAHGQIFGLTLFASRERDRFGDGNARVIRTVCDQVSAMLERMRLLEELQASEQSLRSADRAKDAFIATLAHELRNPLAPIRNAIEVMRHDDPEHPRRLRWCRDIISRQITQMTHLLEDLLDVSRMTRNTIELRRDRIDLLRAIGQAVESSQPLIDSRGHRLELDLPAEPIQLCGDLTRLTQVFTNLLNNATKYTDRAGTIRLTVVRDGESACVCVRDTGIGIEPENLPRVFDMFAQVEPGRAGGGLGIGLALTRRLVELHGGTIEARSDGAGRGSEFVVRLPTLPASAAPPSEPRASHDGVEAEIPHCRVLVVDDNVDAARTLATMLALKGQDVRTAFGGRTALEIAARWRPQVIVLDLGLPDVNGYEVCRGVRSSDLQPSPLLIACTGWGQDEDRERSREAGFDAHLVKPIEADDVLRLLSRAAVETTGD